jgi:CheY-like chemotaxis protein
VKYVLTNLIYLDHTLIMKTILIVDDESEERVLLSKKLIDSGYYAISAGNGNEALNIIQKENIDLILLDLIMPNMDGFSFVYELNKISKSNIPIIILSNMDTTSYPSQVKEFLVKPHTTLENIVDTVKKYISI